MVSAIAPNAHIILVEANSATMANLGTAVNEAVTPGREVRLQQLRRRRVLLGHQLRHHATTTTPAWPITASSGDGGYGVEYPAASQYVTAVGGTALNTASNARGWTETRVVDQQRPRAPAPAARRYDAKPTWQTDTGCAKRTVADVSAVADPATGVAVYETYGGHPAGTSTAAPRVASPLIAAVYADAGTPSAGSSRRPTRTPTPASLNDVTSGSTATCSPAYLCTAEAGYDGPTGLGTPNGLAAFTG